ncbi:MAG: hypothetical protein WCO63_08070 [Bacteroidota bacterium]
MPVKKKKKPVRIRYRKIEIKVSSKQKSLLDKFCKIHNTSTKRLVKRAVREFLERHASNPEDEYYISPNQLKLFEEEEEIYEKNPPEIIPELPDQDDLGGLFSMSIRPGTASG